MSTKSAKQKILDAASILFYNDGITNTGINSITDKAQVHSPIDGILAIFDAYHDHAEFAYEKGFRGCGLLNAAAEFPAHSPERLAVKKHKDEIENIVAGYLMQQFEDSKKVQEL